VTLRYFPGLTIDETAEMLRSSAPTAKRDWTFARAGSPGIENPTAYQSGSSGGKEEDSPGLFPRVSRFSAMAGSSETKEAQAG